MLSSETPVSTNERNVRPGVYSLPDGVRARRRGASSDAIACMASQGRFRWFGAGSVSSSGRRHARPWKVPASTIRTSTPTTCKRPRRRPLPMQWRSREVAAPTAPRRNAEAFPPASHQVGHWRSGVRREPFWPSFEAAAGTSRGSNLPVRRPNVPRAGTAGVRRPHRDRPSSRCPVRSRAGVAFAGTPPRSARFTSAGATVVAPRRHVELRHTRRGGISVPSFRPRLVRPGRPATSVSLHADDLHQSVGASGLEGGKGSWPTNPQ